MRRATLTFLISIIFAAVGLFLISMIITPFLSTSAEESAETAILTRVENTILYTLQGLNGQSESLPLTLPKQATLTLVTPSASCEDAQPIKDEDQGIYIILTSPHATRIRSIPLTRIRDENTHVTTLEPFCITLTGKGSIRIRLSNGKLRIEKA